LIREKKKEQGTVQLKKIYAISQKNRVREMLSLSDHPPCCTGKGDDDDGREDTSACAVACGDGRERCEGIAVTYF
jgi:hypothetical protein